MNYRPLGRTGLMVSEIGLGTRAWGGNQYPNNYGPADDRWSKVSFSRALGAGCTFIDTADHFGHGHCESLIGSVTNCRKDIVIATKGGRNFYNRLVEPRSRSLLEARLGYPWANVLPDDILPLVHSSNFSEDYLRFALEQSRRRLRKECLDLYLLDGPSTAEIQTGQIFDTLDQLKTEGYFLFYGVSIGELEAGMAAIEDGRPDVIELSYNLLDHEPARQRLLDRAAAKNIGVIVREPLANGLLSNKFRGDESFPEGDIRANFDRGKLLKRVEAGQRFAFLAKSGRTPTQAAIRFVLSHPAVSTVIVGCKTPPQATENFAAVESLPLSEKELGLIDEVVLA